MKTFKFFLALLILLLISSHHFAQITTFPHSTDFASGFGDWNQSSTDDFDWTQKTTGTTSSGTGPQSSPYGANGTTGYVYTETSSPITTNQTARIYCTYDLSSATSANVTFYYHIYASYGYGPGTLRLKIFKGNSSSSGTYHYPWTVTTSYNGWQQVTIDLADYIGYSYIQLAFESITPASGTVWQCDNAIDEVVVSTTTNSGGGNSGNTVEVGDPNSNLENGRVPAYGYYDFSWSAAIYHASDLGNQQLDIDKISWNVTNGNSMTMTNQEIWFAHTSEMVFLTGDEPVPALLGPYIQWVKVYDGTLDFVPGWNEVMLQTIYPYNGTDNLLVKVVNEHGSWASSYPEFQYTAKENTVVYNYADGSFPSAAGFVNDYRPNTRFGHGGSALPIVLVSFEGEVIDDNVKLDWVVASQVNNDYYTIEKSLDAYNWEELATLPGAGNSNQEISYTTYDESPIIGHNYYRLTQTDYDGKFETFRPIAVTLKGERKEVVKRTNLLGQPVKDSYIGIVILTWDNGDIQKIYQNK